MTEPTDPHPESETLARLRRVAPFATVPVVLFFGIWIALQLRFIQNDTASLRDEVAALHVQVVELKKATNLAGLRPTASRGNGASPPKPTPKAKQKAPKAKTKTKAKAKAAPAEGEEPRAKSKGKAKAKAGAEARDAEAQPRKKKRKKRKKRNDAPLPVIP